MSTLRSSLEALTAQFTNGLLDAIRSASLEELIGPESSRRPHGRAMPRGSKSDVSTAKPAKKTGGPGRLPRRSAEDIAAILDQIVALVKKNKDGLRAEQIRETLSLQAKELPRVLKEGLASKKLKSKGQKRATTYSAA